MTVDAGRKGETESKIARVRAEWKYARTLGASAHEAVALLEVQLADLEAAAARAQEAAPLLDEAEQAARVAAGDAQQAAQLVAAGSLDRATFDERFLDAQFKRGVACIRERERKAAESFALAPHQAVDKVARRHDLARQTSARTTEHCVASCLRGRPSLPEGTPDREAIPWWILDESRALARYEQDSLREGAIHCAAPIEVLVRLFKERRNGVVIHARILESKIASLQAEHAAATA